MVIKVNTVNSSTCALGEERVADHNAALSIRIDVVRDIDGFTALEDSWNEVLRQSSANVVFLTYEWLSVWLQNHQAAASDLRVIVAKTGSDIVGLVPLMITDREGFRRLGSIGVESLDYEDIIVRDGADIPAVIDAIVGAVFDESGWDYWQHNRLGRSGEIVIHLTAALEKNNHIWNIAESEFSSVVPVHGEWDAYWRSLSKRFRKNFRRHSNRLAESYGKIEISRADTESEIREGLGHLFKFHRARRKDVSGSEGLFVSDSRRDYYTDLALRLNSVGWLNMPIMRIDGQVVGVQFNTEYGGSLSKALPGFDPDFADYAVGMQLNVDVMKNSFASQLNEVDFLRGDEGYKSDFRPNHIQLHSLTVFNNSFRGRTSRLWTQQLRPFVKNKLNLRRLKSFISK